MSGNAAGIHAQVKARVWQAIAQADIDLSAVPKSDLTSLVDIVTEAALLETDSAMETLVTKEQAQAEAATAPAESMLHEGEKVLWEGRPLLSILTHYRITTERIRITTGLLGKERTDIELLKIQEITQTATLGERIMAVGDIIIKTHYEQFPTVVLNNIADVQRVHEVLRRAMLKAREEANFAYREEM